MSQKSVGNEEDIIPIDELYKVEDRGLYFEEI